MRWLVRWRRGVRRGSAGTFDVELTGLSRVQVRQVALLIEKWGS